MTVTALSVTLLVKVSMIFRGTQYSENEIGNWVACLQRSLLTGDFKDL